MMDLGWAHAAAGLIGAIFGAIGGAFVAGRRTGQLEGALDMKVADSEAAIKAHIGDEIGAFDETLKGLRQKINDVERDALIRYLPREEFNDFRAEYREDIREVKHLIRNGNGH